MIKRIIVGKYAVNCYLLMCDETKEAAIIDPGAHAHLIDREVVALGADVKYVILTHGHGDHIGATSDVKSLYDAKIIASEKEFVTLQTPEYNASEGICGEALSITADHYVRDNETLEVGKLTLKFIETPGHTEGGMCILVGNDCFTGDTLFNRAVGRWDLYGGNQGTLKQSIFDRLLVLPDATTIYPGHGPASTIGDEKKLNSFLW